jgi:hypothetical protein
MCGGGNETVVGRKKDLNLSQNRSIYARVFAFKANNHLRSPVEDGLDLFWKEQKVWFTTEIDAAILNDPKTSPDAGTAAKLLHSTTIRDH